MANKLIIDVAKDFLAVVRKSRVGTILPHEMAVIMNQATEAVVSDKFKHIENDKKAYNDLLPLKAVYKSANTEAAIDSNDLFPNISIALPDGFRRDIRLVAKFGTNAPTKMILLRSNESTDILNGVFSRPDIYQSYYTFYNNGTTASLKVYKGNITDTLAIQLDYYKQPTLISETDITAGLVTSQFGSEMNQEIVKMAALMYLERVQDARVQTFSSEINNK